jgi:hypothetical protein
MALFFYAVCILGVMLGGLVLLVLYSLLVMAQRSDESLDQLAREMPKNYQAASLMINKESASLRVADTSGLYHGASPEGGFSPDMESV